MTSYRQPFGPGPYDPFAKRYLQETGAEALVLVVAAGHHGHGFSMAVRAESAFEAAQRIEIVADTMQSAIDMMRADAKRLRDAAVGEKS